MFTEYSNSPLLFTSEPMNSTSSESMPSWPQLEEKLNCSLPLLLKKCVTCGPHHQVFIAHSTNVKHSDLKEYEVWITPKDHLEEIKEKRARAAQAWGSLLEDEVFSEVVDEWGYLIILIPSSDHLKLPSFKENKFKENKLKEESRSRKHEHETLNSEMWNTSEQLNQNLEYYTHFVKAAEPLALFLIQLHDKGQCLGGFNPSQWIIHRGECRPIWMLPIYLDNQPLSLSQDEKQTILGFSPPESYGYFKATSTPSSDVFSFGIWLFYALTGVPLLSETRRPFNRIPSAHIYHPKLMPELVSVIRRATSSYPTRRYNNMKEMWRALCWSISVYQERCSKDRSPTLSIEIGHEIHIGLLKGQYNPTNQDDLFLGYQPESERGLFVVTDGVSISEYGSGDIASGYVRQEAFETWRQMSQTHTSEEEETISEMAAENIYRNPSSDRKILTNMLDRANQRIGEHINAQIPVFHGRPEGIMAATSVAALIDKNRVMLASVGDSRIYLIREGHICNLMVDDDLATHLMQMGQTPTQAQQTPSASALINCVGEFKKNTENRLVPVHIRPQFLELNLLADDYLVLCSDGLPDYGGTDEEDAERNILRVVESSFSTSRAAFELISLANRGGGGDNLSCIVLHFFSDQETLN